MKRASNIAGQFLIVTNVFIAFLLVFEHKMVVPQWLQPVGRMHPLLLHFPIVLVILAMCIDLFRNNKTASHHFYADFSRHILLAGVLLTAVTVIMGLFLSKEQGYNGDTLLWHKWTGVFTLLFASMVYWIRDLDGYTAFVRRTSSLAVITLLIFAGHFGAALTHGEDFLFQPLAVAEETTPVPIEQAVLFDDLIKPVLEKKCAACHKPGKMKGELSLLDSASIVKGGKTGKLFVPGDIATSLLLERLHLPLEAKKHMPPLGKPQLTAEEEQLLRLWIASGANFSMPVMQLPENDSLHLLAKNTLQPAGGDAFDFPPADEKTIIALNDNYRTIRPIAKESPALSVDMFNAASYEVKRLEELSAIQTQIVSLNLNKLPVKDEDLKRVGQFENIRKLELNYTNVTAEGLKQLAALQHLHTITLAGTNLSYNSLKAQLPSLKGLKKIVVSNAGLSVTEAEQLQRDNNHLTIIAGFKNSSKDTLMLNPPQVKNNSVVFDQQLTMQLKHPVKGVKILFSAGGKQFDSTQSALFDGTTILNKTTRIYAKAYKDGWYSSEVTAFDFYKCSIKPDSMELLYPLEHRHLADGPATFFDKKLGVIEPNNGAWANNWAGAREQDMAIVSRFNNPVMVSNVGLRYMCEEVSGIYPPEVEVWGGEDEKNLKLLMRIKPALPAKGEKPTIQLAEGNCKSQTVSCLKVVAKPYRKNGNNYLLLVDEMFIN